MGRERGETVAEMEAVPRVRRPDRQYALDQIMGQARWLNRTIGVTAADLIGVQCAAPVGLAPSDQRFRTSTALAGVWFETEADAIAHQQAMDCLPAGRYAALVVSPLAMNRLPRPDLVLLYATPGQMIILINGLQFSGYKKFDFTCVGESACADSWGRALRTGEPSVSIPCYAERRFGGVQDNELLMALPPRYLPKAIDGMTRLSRNGLRYPIAPLGLESSPAESMARSYGNR